MTGSFIIKQIPITIRVAMNRRDIEQGEHDCRWCPAAVATNRALDDAGFRHVYAYVAPYGINPRFELRHEYRCNSLYVLPNIPDGLTDCAINFDDWKDFQDDLEEWRMRHGEDADLSPCEPDPISFEFQVTPSALAK